MLQFQVFQREFHNQVLNTVSSNVGDTFAVVQLAYDHVMESIQEIEQLEQVSLHLKHNRIEKHTKYY